MPLWEHGILLHIFNQIIAELLIIWVKPPSINRSSPSVSALSVSCAHLPCTIVLGEYFEKRRGLANAVANLGASVAGIMWPPLIVYLLEQYDLRGTLIIIGGVYLHFIPVGLIMRDLELTEKGSTDKRNRKQTGNDCYINKTFTTADEDLSQNVEVESGRNSSMQKGNVIGLAQDKGAPDDLPEHTSENIFTIPEPKLDSTNNLETDRTPCKKNNKENFIFKILKTIFDASLLQNKCFLLLMASSFLIAAPSAIPITYIPPFGSDRGLEINQLGYIVTISGASAIVGNIIFIFISDTTKVRRHHMLTIAMTANGVICLFSSLFTNFASLAVFGVLHTIFGEAYFCLINVLVVDFLGMDKMKYGIVTATITKDVSMAITSVVVGMLLSIFYIPVRCHLIVYR